MEANQRKLRLMLRERANVSCFTLFIWLDSNLRKQMPWCPWDPRHWQSVEVFMPGTKPIKPDGELAPNHRKANWVSKQFLGSFASLLSLLTHGSDCKQWKHFADPTLCSWG